MRIGAFLRRHTLIAGLLAVLVPLVILLAVQFVWLFRLERAQAIAHAAALESFLGSVGTQIEYEVESPIGELFVVQYGRKEPIAAGTPVSISFALQRGVAIIPGA